MDCLGLTDAMETINGSWAAASTVSLFEVLTEENGGADLGSELLQNRYNFSRYSISFWS